VKVCVTVRRHGTAVAKAGTCTARRVGDALVFHILDCVISIAKDYDRTSGELTGVNLMTNSEVPSELYR
jgi:hypothetical protein